MVPRSNLNDDPILHPLPWFTLGQGVLLTYRERMPFIYFYLVELELSDYNIKT